MGAHLIPRPNDIAGLQALHRRSANQAQTRKLGNAPILEGGIVVVNHLEVVNRNGLSGVLVTRRTTLLGHRRKRRRREGQRENTDQSHSAKKPLQRREGAGGKIS